MATIPSSNRSINSTFWQKKIKNKISREKTESKDWRPRIRIKDQDWGFKRLIEHVPFFFPLPFFFNQSTSQMLISKHQDSSNSWNLTCCFSYSLSHSSVPSKLQLFFFFLHSNWLFYSSHLFFYFSNPLKSQELDSWMFPCHRKPFECLHSFPRFHMPTFKFLPSDEHHQRGWLIKFKAPKNQKSHHLQHQNQGFNEESLPLFPVLLDY